MPSFLPASATRLALVLAVCLLPACGSGGADGRDDERSSAPLMDGPAPGVAGADASLPAPLDLPPDAPTVVFLGDSIGAGLHLPEHQAFPALLQRRLAKKGLPFRLVSSCESGRTTAGGVTALAWVLRSKPKLVVIELGGNDGLRNIPLETVEGNLRAMIETAHEAGAKVLLLGVRIPPNYGAYARDFDALYPKLADEYALAFVPFFMNGVGGIPEMNLPDGMHPTAKGQQRLADNVEPTLEAALRTLGKDEDNR